MCEVVSDDIDEDVEQYWIQDASLWDATDGRKTGRQCRPNLNRLGYVSQERLDRKRKVSMDPIACEFCE